MFTDRMLMEVLVTLKLTERQEASKRRFLKMNTENSSRLFQIQTKFT